MKPAIWSVAAILLTGLSLTASGSPALTAVPGSLIQVSVGADGTTWGINGANQIFMFSAQAQGWELIAGSLSQIAVGASSAVWGLNDSGNVYRFDASINGWDCIPGNLAQIAVGADGDVWGLNVGQQIYHFLPDTQSWDQIPGYLTQIAVGFDGAVWGLNAQHQIYRFNPGTNTFEWVAGALSQIAVGADGEVWGVNSESQIYHFNPLRQGWDEIPGALAQISVGSATTVWGVNSSGSVYTFNVQSQSWLQISGTLSQISAGANGTVWGINRTGDLFSIPQPTQATQTFSNVPGALAQIAVASDGQVWGINNTGQIYTFTRLTQSWTWIPGALAQIAIARDGNVWGINSAGEVYAFDLSSQKWAWKNGQLSQIGVADNGAVWGINSNQSIYRYDAALQSWQQIPGDLEQISVGADGTVWGINYENAVYQWDAQGQYWVQMPGSFSQIAVGSSANVWALNSAGQAYNFNAQTQTWYPTPGSFEHLSAAFDGTAWALGAGGAIYRFDAQIQDWSQIPGALNQVATGTDAVIWGINSTQSIYQFQAPDVIPLASSVDIYPGMDIPTLVNLSPGGTTFVIHPGTYRLTAPISALNGDTFIGQTPCAPPGTACPAILSGSTEIGSLAIFDGTNYEVAGQTQQGVVKITSAQCEPGWAGCIYPEDLFFDGVPLQHLNSASLPAIASGQWWFDYANHVIYFHDNPAGHLVETSVVPNAFGGIGNNVTISQLTIEEFASPIGSPGTIGMPGDASLFQGINWTIEDCEILLNHGTAVRVAFGMQILNNYIHNNGDLGIGGGTATNSITESTPSGIVIGNNMINNNNYAHVLPGFQSGGVKISATTGVVIRGNTITNNDGGGVHFDQNSQSPLVDGNTITDNTGADGIAYEISLISATIRNNILLRNGADLPQESTSNGGLSSTDSAGVNAYCNVIEVPNAAGANGALVIASDRGNNGYYPYEYLVSTGNDFHHNTVIWDAGADGLFGYQQSDAANQPNFFADNTPPDFNTYHLPSLSLTNFVYDGDDTGQNSRKTFAQYQASGADIHGSADTNYRSGFPTVAITSPADQSSFANLVAVTATASDVSGISMVEFYVDWNLQDTVTNSPYTFNWSNASPGSHTIAAMAYSNAGIRNCYAITITSQ